MKNIILGTIILIFCYWTMLVFGAANPELFLKIFANPADELRSFARLIMPQNANKMWQFPEISQEKGVIQYNKGKSWGDYTTYANTLTGKTVAIDMQGNIVHEWNTKFTTENLTYPDNVVTMRVFSDPKNRENIYVMYRGEKMFHNAYGIKKFNRDSNVIWHNDREIHHDMFFLENGDLILYEKRLRTDRIPGFPALPSPVYEDLLVFANDKGEIYREISLFDAFTDSPYVSALETAQEFQFDPLPPLADVIHPNTIELVPKSVSDTLPNVTENSIMLSFRNTDALAFLDLDTEKITWVIVGPWRRQHSPRFLDNGHVIMLDNSGYNGPEGRSRLLEIDLHDLSIVWEYNGTKEKPFYTRFNGMIDLLPNGNILVTETHSGRIFEITKDKEIVWEYYVHERIPHPEGTRVPSVVSAQRFSKDELPFLHAN